MAAAVLDFDGFFLRREFFVKELCIARLDDDIRPYARYLFHSPRYLKSMTPEERRTLQHQERLHGFRWKQGNVPASEVETTIRKACQNFKTVFVKGREKKIFIANLLKSIADVSEIDEHLYVDESVEQRFACCSFPHGTLNPQHCAVIKAQRFAAALLQSREERCRIHGKQCPLGWREFCCPFFVEDLGQVSVTELPKKLICPTCLHEIPAERVVVHEKVQFLFCGARDCCRFDEAVIKIARQGIRSWIFHRDIPSFASGGFHKFCSKIFKHPGMARTTARVRNNPWDGNPPKTAREWNHRQKTAGDDGLWNDERNLPKTAGDDGLWNDERNLPKTAGDDGLWNGDNWNSERNLPKTASDDGLWNDDTWNDKRNLRSVCVDFTALKF